MNFIYKDVVGYFLKESFNVMKEENTSGCEMKVGTVKDENGKEYSVTFTLDPVEETAFEISCCESFVPMIEPEEQLAVNQYPQGTRFDSSTIHHLVSPSYQGFYGQ